MKKKKNLLLMALPLTMLVKCGTGIEEAPIAQIGQGPKMAVTNQLQTAQLSVTTCTGWTPFEGDKRIVPAFPDKASRYDNLAFTVDSGNFIALRLSGTFPHARYLSFNVYDFAAASGITAIADYEIEPAAGSVNPYRPGAYRGAQNRAYAVYFVKQGVSLNLPQGSNIIEIPANIRRASIMTRVYRADNGYDNLGGAGLPLIEALSASNASCPDIGLNQSDVATYAPLLFFNDALIETWQRLRSYQANRSGNLDFFHFDGSGYLPNNHNKYVFLPLPPVVSTENVAVLKFKVPTFENTSDTNGIFGGHTQTRYWSFCIGDLSATGTPECVNDEYFKPDKNGTATLVVSDISMKAIVEAAGFTFLRWGVAYKPILIFRHMLDRADFTGRITLIPQLPMPTGGSFSDADLDSKRGQNFIGNYSPTGSLMGRLEFLRKLALRKI